MQSAFWLYKHTFHEEIFQKDTSKDSAFKILKNSSVINIYVCTLTESEILYVLLIGFYSSLGSVWGVYLVICIKKAELIYKMLSAMVCKYIVRLNFSDL